MRPPPSNSPNGLRSMITTTMINLPHDPIDASIGVAQWHLGSSAHVVLAAADRALLVAEAAGGGTIVSASGLTHSTGSESSAVRPPTRNGPLTAATAAVSVNDVLDVVARFDEFGGASVELTAWELNAHQPLVATAWSCAIRDGLLEPAGTEPDSGEDMWRLSDTGRRANKSAGED